jgi:hypothetical protein
MVKIIIIKAKTKQKDVIRNHNQQEVTTERDSTTRMLIQVVCECKGKLKPQHLD